MPSELQQLDRIAKSELLVKCKLTGVDQVLLLELLVKQMLLNEIFFFRSR